MRSSNWEGREMKSNFDFLKRYWPALAQIGATAESYVFSDPNACLYKLGMFGERLVLEIFAFEHIPEPETDNTHAARIRILKREGLLPKKIDDILYALRKTRNDAVHSGADSVDDAKTLLQMTYSLATWFMEVYGDWGYIPAEFVMPAPIEATDYESIIKAQEEKIASSIMCSSKIVHTQILLRDRQRISQREKTVKSGSLPLLLFSLPIPKSADLCELADGLLIGEPAALYLLHECFGLVLKVCKVRFADLPRAPLALDPIDGFGILL